MCEPEGNETYSVCGLTCAGGLQLVDVGMCNFCGQRPKVVQLYGMVHPHCEQTCCRKAKLAGQGSATSSSAETFDGAPFLLEVPSGHVAFKRVADYFAASWKEGTKSCPDVQRIYRIVLNPGFQARYEEYCSRVDSHGPFTKRGNEKKRWIGLIRNCGFGNPGITEPCLLPRCMLCSLTRSMVSPSNFPEGVTTADAPNRAIDVSSSTRNRSDSKVVVIADVLLGREIEIGHDQLVQPLPPPESDSVHIIGYHPYRGTKMDFGEVVVYNGDAIKPLYLISFA